MMERPKGFLYNTISIAVYDKASDENKAKIKALLAEVEALKNEPYIETNILVHAL